MAIGYKQFTRNLVEKLKDHFMIQEWDIQLNWEMPEEHESAAAAINITDQYLFANLFLSDAMQTRWENGDWFAFIDTLVHEFSHIITEPLYVIAINGITNPASKHLEDTRERQTQRVTNLVMKSIPASFKEGFNFPVKAKKPVPKKKKAK